MKCIFCLSETYREPIEHIAPEGLVGHQPFQVTYGSIIAEPRKYLVLDNDEVCRRCNNKLGKLDENLQNQLGFLRTYWNPVGTKSGKATTAQRPGMFAERRSDGPHIHVNAENYDVRTLDGVHIQPAGTHEMAVRVKDFKIEGTLARVTIEQPVRMNKRFVRALHKIGFELLCLQNGAEFVLDQKYDPLREYILHGRGNREILMTRSSPEGSWEKSLFNLRHDPSWPGWLAIIRLGGDFFVDLSPANDFFLRADLAELKANDIVKWSDQDGGRQVTVENSGPKLPSEPDSGSDPRNEG